MKAWLLLFIALAFGPMVRADEVAEYDIAPDQAAAGRLLGQIPLAEWMGPLAPVALSPFFGLACLSGASILVERGVLPENLLLRGNPALNNETVFVVLVLLAALTSLPRLTKISKPIAQLGDMLETYAGIVMMAVVAYFGMNGTSGAEAAPDLVMASLFGDIGFVLVAIISALNIIVIQTVRFFFEVLIFLSPIPFLDAFFEVVNKSVCFGLMAIYALHPGAALAANIVLFLICLVMFRWARRKLAQFREKVLKPLWGAVKRRFARAPA